MCYVASQRAVRQLIVAEWRIYASLKLSIIGSDNGLSPDRRQAIIWTNAGILLTGHLGINFNEILIGIHAFSFKKIYLKMSSGKWRLSCPGLNVLKYHEVDRYVNLFGGVFVATSWKSTIEYF